MFPIHGSHFQGGTVSYKVIGNAFRTLSLPRWRWIKPKLKYSSRPLATMISPIYIAVDVQQTISIPTIDADHDEVRCHFASGGSVCPPNSLPNSTTISYNCTFTIIGTQ
ncbi:unnamed protein product [Rotaria sordida]|uniref:Uncharacterized protein n=1 Tax=Rotaria sordida TaxID=392033 RepID=A0A818G5L2_9BILA|nr:unnamed protein product [Rotaria sordida]CAF0794289.1 unnamed protein product [Rotaria sordida]CAF3486529.1 unnamed protein product [Rotaria sordida]CAF3553903.1 unnamed protein product [Rotaria sordida]